MDVFKYVLCLFHASIIVNDDSDDDGCGDDLNLEEEKKSNLNL